MSITGIGGCCCSCPTTLGVGFLCDENRGEHVGDLVGLSWRQDSWVPDHIPITITVTRVSDGAVVGTKAIDYGKAAAFLVQDTSFRLDADSYDVTIAGGQAYIWWTETTVRVDLTCTQTGSALFRHRPKFRDYDVQLTSPCACRYDGFGVSVGGVAASVQPDPPPDPFFGSQAHYCGARLRAVVPVPATGDFLPDTVITPPANSGFLPMTVPCSPMAAACSLCSWKYGGPIALDVDPDYVCLPGFPRPMKRTFTYGDQYGTATLTYGQGGNPLLPGTTWGGEYTYGPLDCVGEPITTGYTPCFGTTNKPVKFYVAIILNPCGGDTLSTCAPTGSNAAPDCTCRKVAVSASRSWAISTCQVVAGCTICPDLQAKLIAACPDGSYFTHDYGAVLPAEGVTDPRQATNWESVPRRNAADTRHVVDLGSPGSPTPLMDSGSNLESGLQPPRYGVYGQCDGVPVFLDLCTEPFPTRAAWSVSEDL